jgi:DNA-binding CsgD family transcriptional regulator
MGIALSAADITAISNCSRVLLSVLDDASTQAWAGRVMDAARPLLGADRMCVALPVGDGFAVFPSDDDVREAARSYQEYYHTTDVWTTARLRALGLSVYSYDMVITRPEQNRSEFWNDWILPYRMCKPAGVSRQIEGCPVPATLMGYKGIATAPRFGERELEILRLLQPSFESAVRSLERFRRTGNDLLAYVDHLPIPALVVGLGGVLHANDAFRRALGAGGCDVINAVLPGALTLLRSERRAQVPTVAGTVPGPHGTMLRWSVHMMPCAAGTPLAIVHFDLPVSSQLTEEACARIGLSPRQTQVARMMADRWSYKEIASQLGIRPNTARRHCEQVLTRLGVHSRHELRQALLRMAGSVAG